MSCNIILIISDTFRYDNLIRDEVPTPELDRLREKAFFFDTFYAASFPTVPHRTDTVTGRYTCFTRSWSRLPDDEPHIAELLSQHGYVSQLITDCPHNIRQNIHRGYTAYHFRRRQENDTNLLNLNEKIPEYLPDNKARTYPLMRGTTITNVSIHLNKCFRYEDERHWAHIGRTAARWIEDNYTFSPFLLCVDFFDPHEPWDVPEYIMSKFDPDYKGLPMAQPNYGPSSAYTESELVNMKAHYNAESHLVDRAIGSILRKIEDTGLMDNTIIVFTSDHGMFIGEHGRTGKHLLKKGEDDRRWPLYDEVQHVPFILYIPGMEGEKTVTALGQPPDILPTLLDLTGLEVEHPLRFHGRSLAPFIKGEEEDPQDTIGICSQCVLHDFPHGVMTREWKYFPKGEYEKPELYHRPSDPTDTKNVYEDNKGIARKMEKGLLGWLKEKDAPEETIEGFKAQFPKS